MTIGVDTEALVEKNLAIGALFAADEKDQIVLGGELRDVGHAVSHRTTDGVEALEGGLRGDV